MTCSVLRLTNQLGLLRRVSEVAFGSEIDLCLDLDRIGLDQVLLLLLLSSRQGFDNHISYIQVTHTLFESLSRNLSKSRSDSIYAST